MAARRAYLLFLTLVAVVSVLTAEVRAEEVREQFGVGLRGVFSVAVIPGDGSCYVGTMFGLPL